MGGWLDMYSITAAEFIIQKIPRIEITRLRIDFGERDLAEIFDESIETNDLVFIGEQWSFMDVPLRLDTRIYLEKCMEGIS